jgi:integrase
MSVDADLESAPSAPSLSVATDYLGLTAEQRYDVISQKFPSWLLAEPIVFPRHDPTFGWACLVNGCEALPARTYTRLLCVGHGGQYRQVKDSIGIEDFARDARPWRAKMGGALSRWAGCSICGTNREAKRRGYCGAHRISLRSARAQGISEIDWRRTQVAFPPLPRCSIPQCVHDGVHCALRGSIATARLCHGHSSHWRSWLKSAGRSPDVRAWDIWSATAATGNYVTPASSRGQVTLTQLPIRLQREVRYAIHRHANTAKRTQWRPRDLQRVVSALVEAEVESLGDQTAAGLERVSTRGEGERRVWAGLVFAARSLSVTSSTAKSDGWFDPVIVGAAPFPGSQGSEHRRKVWSLTEISQRWLRDLLWEHLKDEALRPDGKRPGRQTIYRRIRGIALLSNNLRQNRIDHGENPGLLGDADAKAVKDTWDLWLREQIPIPSRSQKTQSILLTEASRYQYISSIQIVLQHGREKGLTEPGFDSFILGLPEFPAPTRSPRPRPLSFGDFQLLISAKALCILDTADREGIGLTDIWLTQAFQGGRIGETLNLRLGCVGLIGAAQPYMWRDIQKVKVVDYGMPCHLPVYERLLRRQSITKAKLRARYANELASLDDDGRARLEASWDRTMPLFPRAFQNPDLVAEASQSWFRDTWTEWFEGLGLSGITTHQTRATLATSLLNNGAPAALVRQLLGHFSEEALAHYARYSDESMTRHLQQVWAAGPGTDKPGTILLRPNDLKADDSSAAVARIDLAVVPVEHGLCRYGPVVGGANCPFDKNCTNGERGPCEHFVLTGADLAYWERKRDAAFHFAEGAPSDEARDYILSEWHPWEPVLAGLREALDELGLLEEAEQLDLRTPVHDYFNPLFSTGWTLAQLDMPDDPQNADPDK